MILSEIVASLHSFDEDRCIIAKRPWSGDAEAQVVQLTEGFRIPEGQKTDGFEYFLEISVARDEVLEGIEHRLSAEQRLSAIIYYAENDACPKWLCDLRG